MTQKIRLKASNEAGVHLHVIGIVETASYVARVTNKQTLDTAVHMKLLPPFATLRRVHISFYNCRSGFEGQAMSKIAERQVPKQWSLKTAGL